MTQLKLRLLNDLREELKTCEELRVAVAMISDYGFFTIQDYISKDAKQCYLVGIDLPTSPKALQSLREKETSEAFCSRIYHKSNQLFHPKVYMLKTNDRFVVYLGSGNCTEGGLSKNVELNVKVEDQEICEVLWKWFETQFKFGFPITDDFLQKYADIFERRKARINDDSAEISSIVPEQPSVIDLDKINFTNQFFKREHFAAFEGKKPMSITEDVNQERINVRNRLFKLHSLLYPEIKRKRWDLYEHYVFDDTVSSAVHGQYTSQRLDGIWLHYGRSKADIKAFAADQTPLDFMRLQVIIHKDNVGIWNRVGKDHGSRIDREYFKSNMSGDPSYRHGFFSIVSMLPDEFFIRVNNNTQYVREFKTESQLSDFVLTDDIKYYFIIGIEFSPDSAKISEPNIVDTIMSNFALLYPTYEMMKYDLRI